MLICGMDEVGRGALAGPLVAVAALFNGEVVTGNRYSWQDLETANSPIKGINDSKKLTPKKRRQVFHLILRSQHFIDFGLGEVSADEINQRGIDWANQEAFRRAVNDLRVSPEFILIDGDNPLMGWDMQRQQRRPQADGYWWPVGAASILAKVIRDSYMAELSLDWPGYGWQSNSGYGAEVHRRGLLQWGATPEHRTQFIQRIVGGQTSNAG